MNTIVTPGSSTWEILYGITEERLVFIKVREAAYSAFFYNELYSYVQCEKNFQHLITDIRRAYIQFMASSEIIGRVRSSIYGAEFAVECEDCEYIDLSALDKCSFTRDNILKLLTLKQLESQ